MSQITTLAKVSNVVTLNKEGYKSNCLYCNFRSLCLPGGLNVRELEQLGDMVAARKFIKRGSYLYRKDGDFNTLYVVRSGFFKTSICAQGGRDQVTGFRTAGEVLGLDAIDSGRYGSDAIALEDSQVCVIAFAQLEELMLESPSLQRQFHQVLSRAIVQNQQVMLLLGGMRAEKRVAIFLLDLTEKLHERGYSSSLMLLRMSRDEIGSYLGLKLETVSRCFSKLQKAGILKIDKREVQILSEPALRNLVNDLP